MSGNSWRRSAAKRSITFAPQPALACRARIIWPMSQYSRTIAAMADRTTRRQWAAIRPLRRERILSRTINDWQSLVAPKSRVSPRSRSWPFLLGPEGLRGAGAQVGFRSGRRRRRACPGNLLQVRVGPRRGRGSDEDSRRNRRTISVRKRIRIRLPRSRGSLARYLSAPAVATVPFADSGAS